MIAVVRGELIRPTAKRFYCVLWPCMSFFFLLYCLTGIMGYVTFTDWVCSNVADAFADDVFVTLGQAGVIVCITGGHPVNMFPLKLAIDKLLFFSRPSSQKRLMVISTIWCGSL